MIKVLLYVKGGAENPTVSQKSVSPDADQFSKLFHRTIFQ